MAAPAVTPNFGHVFDTSDSDELSDPPSLSGESTHSEFPPPPHRRRAHRTVSVAPNASNDLEKEPQGNRELAQAVGRRTWMLAGMEVDFDPTLPSSDDEEEPAVEREPGQCVGVEPELAVVDSSGVDGGEPADERQPRRATGPVSGSLAHTETSPEAAASACLDYGSRSPSRELVEKPTSSVPQKGKGKEVATIPFPVDDNERAGSACIGGPAEGEEREDEEGGVSGPAEMEENESDGTINLADPTEGLPQDRKVKVVVPTTRTLRTRTTRPTYNVSELAGTHIHRRRPNKGDSINKRSVQRAIASGKARAAALPKSPTGVDTAPLPGPDTGSYSPPPRAAERKEHYDPRPLPVEDTASPDPCSLSPFHSRDSTAQTTPAEDAVVTSETLQLEYGVDPKSSIPAAIGRGVYAAECVSAAKTSGLNPYALHPEELQLLHDHLTRVQVTAYLNIRNAILREWLKNPQKALALESAIGFADARWFRAAHVCFDWLRRRGYINHGCITVARSPPLSMQQQQQQQRRRRRRQQTVVVIGAGMSGLSCARQLENLFRQHAEFFLSRQQQPPQVLVLEARTRIGGRLYSREFERQPPSGSPFKAQRFTADMGAMVITGFGGGNPLNVLIRGQLGIPYYALNSASTIYDYDGFPVDQEQDDRVERLNNYLTARVNEFKFTVEEPELVLGCKDFIDRGADPKTDGLRTLNNKGRAGTRNKLVEDAPDYCVIGQFFVEEGWRLKDGISPDADLDLAEVARDPEATVGTVFEEALAQCQGLVEFSPQHFRLMNWHIANLEYSNANTIDRLSLRGYDLDSGNEWKGKHTMIVGGYQSVARGLMECPDPLDVRTGSPVTGIRYAADGKLDPATISCEDGSTVRADHVVCTIPLGVLKATGGPGTVTFDPPLPPWKADAVDRMESEAIHKVFLRFEERFWDSSRDIFAVIGTPSDRYSLRQRDYRSARGRFFMWFDVSETTGLPCLMALLVGAAAEEAEKGSYEDLAAEATEVLRRVFGRRNVPAPIEVLASDWKSEPYARGSYSSCGKHMRVDDYNDLARPIGNLHFAGEHTMASYPATVHGAYMSGLKAASEVFEAFVGPIVVPTPLVLPKKAVSAPASAPAPVHVPAPRVPGKRKTPPTTDSTQTRLEAYEEEIRNHATSVLGEPPGPPPNPRDPFSIYQQHCAGVTRSITEPLASDADALTVLARDWEQMSPEARQPYLDMSLNEEAEYQSEVMRHADLRAEWDRSFAELRVEYEKEHPSVPTPEEIEYQSRPRRARTVVKYTK